MLQPSNWVPTYWKTPKNITNAGFTQITNAVKQMTNKYLPILWFARYSPGDQQSFIAKHQLVRTRITNYNNLQYTLIQKLTTKKQDAQIVANLTIKYLKKQWQTFYTTRRRPEKRLEIATLNDKQS